PRVGRWQNHLPLEKQEQWSRELPPLHGCSSYQGITTGSHRPQLKNREGVLRPDLNLVFDQVAWDSKRKRMVYFTGGRTFAYDPAGRKWSDLAPAVSPPPVSGGALCYDPFNDEIVLAFGGHVAETGPQGKPVGYTGTWVYDCAAGTWKPLDTGEEPPPRMCTRMVCDTKNRLLVAFGGDGQSRYLNDTWVYDTGDRRWRASGNPLTPPPRAGHFTVYDPASGWVIIGGGYNREELDDMWAYGPAADKWLRLDSQVPAGWYLAADIAQDQDLIVLTTSTKQQDDRMSCNEIYPVRTTYALRLEAESLADKSAGPQEHEPVLKRPLESTDRGPAPDPDWREARLRFIQNLPENRWVLLSGQAGRAAPLRTWGSCSFDTRRGRIVYWGGGHCGYGGSDYDFYDVETDTWQASPRVAEYPERAWDKGINPAGVTFGGAPWVRHGRKVYAYDPVSDKVINMKYIALTAGYQPECLAGYEPLSPDFGSGEEFTRSSYVKWATWAFGLETGQWEILCSGRRGLDLTVSTPRGVMAVNSDWGSLYSESGPEQVLFNGEKVKENAVFLLDAAKRSWSKLTYTGPWPQNLYELTALAYDTRRDRVILHGAGPERDELWIFDPQIGRWRKMDPAVRPQGAGGPPVCRREGVYLPAEDVFFTCGYAAGSQDNPGVYVYQVASNAWYRVEIPPPEGLEAWSVAQQNRALTYDPSHGLVLMVLGRQSGDLADAVVYGLRYDHAKAVAGK
ncbi:MAG: hypothetical protein JXQ83_06240, partial [Candidatus Glassbacteria bacterium]|nr:hypothetical protein [Candidatus Glassbacteria bacterium]